MAQDRFIHHDATGLAETLQRVNLSIDEIERELDKLEAAVSNVRRQWAGEAQANFLFAQRRWDRSLRQLHSIARELTRISERGSERLSLHDEAQSRVWQL